MKKKINIRLLIIAALSIVFTMLLSIFMFYDVFHEEVISNLKADARILNTFDLVKEVDSGEYQPKVDDLRITIINSDGTVKYDSNANIGEMDNHSTRPEVSMAKANGEGEDVRESVTMSKSTFYYAILLDDGSVLRVAKEADSIFSIYSDIIPYMIIIAICIFLICMAISHFLVKSIVKPIEAMADNMNDYKKYPSYKELIPFIDTINRQHMDIIKSANLRQEFTANVSHELKTPLTSISGYSELIENGMASDEDIVRFAKEINQNSKRLLTLINDIIRLSELDSTELKLQYEIFDLFELAQNCIRLLKLSAHNHNVTIELKGSHTMVNANKGMIEEVLYNLCDNAIRYNNKGGKVVITTWNEGGHSMLRVSDNGIGISKENQERIFERFYRVDKSRSKETGGTGLGLAIVKHIISQHNANISLESELGKGTSITIKFEI